MEKVPEACAQEGNALLGEALSHVDEAVIILSPEAVITYVNPAFTKIFGVPARNALGRKLDRSLNMRIDPGLGNRIWTRITSGASWKGRMKFTRPDSVEAEIAMTVYPIIRESGQQPGPYGYIAVASDASVEHLVDERLRHAQKMEAIGTLAGGIAHDFNNILSAVLGFSELALMDAPTGSELAENIGEILVAGRRARDLVKQILEFSRQTESAHRPFVMRPIVAEAIKLLHASLPKTIELKASVDSMSAVIADPVEVHQVLMNLCTNAVQELKDAPGTIRVLLKDVEVDDVLASTVPGLDRGPHILMSVSDTGRGMTPEVMARIFDPYFTTKPEGEGRGMGLSVVHGIVSRSGGGIAVESTPGGGTVFTVYWPRIEEEDEAEAERFDKLPTGTERVLFVDDETYQVALAERMLGALGYRVTAVACPLEALHIFTGTPFAFDLVVTDLDMPRMTGVQLAKQIHGQRENIPVILCTGYSEYSNGTAQDRFGVSAVVAKPVVMSKIAETIRKVLG